jgi:hypothetical protein
MGIKLPQNEPTNVNDLEEWNSSLYPSQGTTCLIALINSHWEDQNPFRGFK